MIERCLVIFFALALSALTCLPASANPVSSNIRDQLSTPGKIGEVQVRFFGIRIYSAALFTSKGAAFDWTEPFALELKYNRSFSKKRLITASLSELERLEGKRPDHAQIASKLQTCFRTVKATDRFVAIPVGRNNVAFYFNGSKTCDLDHQGIRERLLGIWLSDRARDTKLSRLLRGLN